MVFIIQHRRRREKKTDYKNRLALVKSGEIRLVVRRSLDNIRLQLIDYEPNGDKTLFSAFSQELRKLGWKYPTGNIPAAYLTGLLIGVKAKSKVSKAILDLGIQKSTKGSRLYAALKGVLDAGVSIPHSKDILPSEERIKGSHISKEIAKNFEEVKEKIIKAS